MKNMFGLGKKPDSNAAAAVGHEVDQQHEEPLEATQPLTTTSLLPVFACGSGLFSDGYINNVIGSVSTVLSREYGDVYSKSSAISNVSSIAFAGTVVGQLIFGYTSDHWSRVNSLMASTVILIIFTALCAGSYWHGSASGLLSILVAWRFFVGIGIGGEYPAGSVSCSESSAELKSGTRNRWFILFTNTAIDVGFLVGALVPYIVAVACDNKYYSTQWRTSLGIGVVFPLVLLILRLKLKEPEEFSRNSMAHVKIPYGLVARFYGPRLLAVCSIWFLYNFSSYILLNFFYLPGSLIGAFVSDWIGPRYTLALGVGLQAIVGFIMAGCYAKLSRPEVVGAFVVVYGIFLSLGEFGPGNNIGLLASKTSATGIRGMYYGIAAATGKVGAFVGTYIYRYIVAAGGDDTIASAQYPFYVSSSLCVVSAAIVLLCLPNVGQDTVQEEDARFRAYLESNGWDTRQLGLKKGESVESVEERRVEGSLDAATDEKTA